MTGDFVEKARAAEPVAVVTEATNMTGASVSSETEVESKLDSIVNQADGIVLAGFAFADVDRLNSFYRIAKKNGRCLAVSPKQAYLLNALRADKGLNVPDLGDSDVFVFRRSKQTMYGWEKEAIGMCSGRVMDAFEVSKRQSSLVLALSFYDLEELVDIKPDAGSCYVVSASEPFNEEMEIDYDRLVNWLEHFGLPQYHVHVSGHIMPLQLKAVLKEVNARKVFPVHTEHAELFCRFMRDSSGEMVLTESDSEYRF
jgi:ribonuclease J